LKEVQNVLPYDYSYAKPFKSSFSTGYFMPDVSKEMINVVVGIDVSGSIGLKEYADFASEVIGMAQAFRNRITIRFLTHDVTVHNDYVVENGNVDKIRKLKIDGGGGTSHKDIMDYIQNKVKNAKLAIFLTDGYSDLENIKLDDYHFKKIFVIQQNGRDDCIKDKNRNKVIRLKGEYGE
jgi:predicted metal-dependent peptidase